jgi:5-methylcytosine-specific restriction endonuclease McrA
MAKEINSLKELISWSYANLARSHSALDEGCVKYKVHHHMIRAKLYKGLVAGSMSMGTLFDDEKIKIHNGGHCSYCGSKENIAVDHLIPRVKGGGDAGDNLIPACRSCNSSKGGQDLMEWYEKKKDFPPLLILRRYLKVVYRYCKSNDLLDTTLDEAEELELPFDFKLIPRVLPPLQDICLLTSPHS